MRYRGLIAASAVAVVLATMSLTVAPIAGQGQAPASTGATFVPPASSYVPPKTPWGDPDLQGTWDYQSIVPMQRPAAYADKPTLTEAEYAVVVRGATGSLAVTVTALFGQRELVTRPLPPEVAENSALSGAAVMSDGQIALIVDCDALVTAAPALATA